jgi:hypothetical protein
MPLVHFQSIYRRYGLVVEEPLCGLAPAFDEPRTPRRDEISCPACLRFLMRLKEPVHA